MACCWKPDLVINAEVVDVVMKQGIAEKMIQVGGVCHTCGHSMRFLGLPAAPLPDAPHAPGSEDGGVSKTTVCLPFIIGKE